MWTYATCCMSQQSDPNKIELHIFSSKKDTSIIELLTVTAHYHRTAHLLGLNHTVNFGRPWQDSSKCEYGLISLPYVDGPELENYELSDGGINYIIKFYWLIPVTESEISFKKKFGIEQLELKFDDEGLDYLNANRKSLIL